MSEDENVGYRNPPASTQFKKGQSGNPKGRPPGRHIGAPYEFLGQMVTIVEDGVERRVTAAEAFLMHIAKAALQGDPAAVKIAVDADEARLSLLGKDLSSRHTRFVFTFVEPINVNTALEPLRMASKLKRYRPNARMMLEPWLVQMALSRLGDQRLSRDQQAAVIRATRTPHKVCWPAWWDVHE